MFPTCISRLLGGIKNTGQERILKLRKYIYKAASAPFTAASTAGASTTSTREIRGYHFPGTP